ncbi:MAG: endonuclease IV [Firmicutes bacterium HGW-Firmicutes-21]|nr:MAG: endonuclease IV [Firmicutes bacterium HGW-Firmicutes-21]
MSVKFGPGGNSQSFYDKGYKSTLQAPEYIKNMGLDAYEYEAGNGLNASMATLTAIGEKAREYGVSMSLHTPYFISLSSVGEDKRLKSVEYLRKSGAGADALGADIMVVHTGSAAKISRRQAMEYAAQTLVLVDIMLAEDNLRVKVGLETMGKVNQLGTLDEVIELCKLSKRFAPVVDFGHINAREQGALRTTDDFKYLFDRISKELGGEYADNLHCHFSKIEYTGMGEKKHLTFKDEVFGPSPELLAEAIISLGVSPTIICESDGTMAEDALELKEIYNEYNKHKKKEEKQNRQEQSKA